MRIPQSREGYIATGPIIGSSLVDSTNCSGHNWPVGVGLLFGRIAFGALTLIRTHPSVSGDLSGRLPWLVLFLRHKISSLYSYFVLSSRAIVFLCGMMGAFGDSPRARMLRQLVQREHDTYRHLPATHPTPTPPKLGPKLWPPKPLPLCGQCALGWIGDGSLLRDAAAQAGAYPPILAPIPIACRKHIPDECPLEKDKVPHLNVPSPPPVGQHESQPKVGLAEPTKIMLKITVPLTKQPIMHWPRPPPPPPPPPPENEEIVARRWLAKTGRYAAKVNNLEEDWWMRFVLCLKQPCGRVEKQGSQQHLIQMVVPSMALAERLVGRGRHGVCMHLGKKYYVDPETRIASWVKSRRVDTYVIEDAYVLGEYLNLHNRNLGKHLLLYKSSKLGPITKSQWIQSMHSAHNFSFATHPGGGSQRAPHRGEGRAQLPGHQRPAGPHPPSALRVRGRVGADFLEPLPQPLGGHAQARLPAEHQVPGAHQRERGSCEQRERGGRLQRSVLHGISPPPLTHPRFLE